jgi:ABC-type amino acid transport substrate-binding protein
MTVLRKLLVLTSLMLPVSVPVASWAQSAPDIVYTYPDQSVWTTETDDQGSPANPLLRLAKTLFAEAGLTWQAQPLPAARMFSALKSGSANFSMLVKAPSLQDCCLLSRQPVAGTDLLVFWRDGAAPVTKREDLIGKLLVVILGYSYGDLAPFLADEKNAIRRTTTAKHQAAFEMLGQGRADYVLDYAGPAREVLADRPIAGLHQKVLSRMDVHLVLSRNYPDAEKAMDKLEAIAQRLDRQKIIDGRGR